MPRRGRMVKERNPKVVQLARSVLGLIWLIAAVSFVSRGGVDVFHWKLTARADFTPFLIAFLLTILVFGGMAFILRMQTAAGKSLQELQALSPDQFEDWVAARFRGLGYSVKVAGAQGDHGVDLVAEKDGELAVIQCKNFKAWSVGEPVLRDLFGAMHDFGASRAYLVTTGRITQAATRWVSGKPIAIWDGEHVARLSKEMAPKRGQHIGQPSAPVQASPAAEAAAPLRVGPAPSPASEASAVCPKCGSTLVQKRNRSTGEPFLACPKYPACRHTQPLPS